MNGVRFVDPPTSMYRRRSLVGPGLLAIVGAVLAVLFLLLLLGVLAAGLGVASGDVSR